MTLEHFFQDFPQSFSLFSAVEEALKALGPSTMKITKSQIAYHYGKPFAYVWVPARYQRGITAPLVISIPLSYRDGTVRWKEVYQVRNHVIMHHKELWSSEGLDQTLLELLQTTYQALRKGRA